MSLYKLRWLLPGIVLIVYARSLLGSFQYDDFNVIVHNAAVHDLSHWHRGLRPLLKLTYALNWALHPAPMGFLAVNVGLHALNAWLVFELILALAPRLDLRERSERAAFLGALVFALHPVQTEAVAYVSGRSAALMATCFLGALLLFLRGHRFGPLACFGLAVATKETALVLPAVALLVFAGAPAQERKPILRACLALGSLLALGLLLHPSYGRLLRFSFELRDASAQVQAALAGIAYLLQKLVWPLGLNIDPPLAHPGGWTGETLTWGLLLLGLLTLALATGRRRPWLGIGIGWFLLTLLPTQGPVPRLDLANERHLYLPLAGVALIVAGLAEEARLRRVLGAACLLLGIGTFVRIGDYRTEIRLWESSLRAAPANARAQNNLGTALALAGRREEAREAFRQALRLRPNYALARENLRGLE
ncbi:MAG: tetratricopeptide repeat protein [Acidobacteria bacterium]|nr:tetratricopeptide repeat protein [Acidobacteriota bacterium]